MTALVSGLVSTAFTDTGLTNGTRYFYKVSATNSAGRHWRQQILDRHLRRLQRDAWVDDVNPISASNESNNKLTQMVLVAKAANAAPAAAYQTCRWAPSFAYTIPGLTAGAKYTVRLHFA